MYLAVVRLLLALISGHWTGLELSGELLNKICLGKTDKNSMRTKEESISIRQRQ
jgi:hypothetical protein